MSKAKPKSAEISFQANKTPSAQLAHYKLGPTKAVLGHLLRTCLQQSV